MYFFQDVLPEVTPPIGKNVLTLANIQVNNPIWLLLLLL
jgi:hypothetical protein